MKTFNQYVSDILQFFASKGMDFGNDAPSIQLDYAENSKFDPFISTGKFMYQTYTITLNVSNRHVKDILRTLCHELVHAWQYKTKPEYFASVDKSGSLEDNAELMQLEQEAYLVGNIVFREWTEQYAQLNVNEYNIA